MTPKTRFLVGAAVLVGAVAYLMYTGVSQSSVYYLTIDEFLLKKEALANEGVRVAGRVAAGSVNGRMTTSGEEITFRMGEFKGEGNDGATVPVHFVGIVPDMFKREGGSDVIVEGKYRDGTLHAQSVLTQCPSKYEAEGGGAVAEAASY
jgi:cytochrome c-type biogenesis protein CcmE